MNRITQVAVSMMLTMCLVDQTYAGVIIDDVGAPGHGFSDGQTLTALDISGLGSTAASSGSDPISNFNATWTHSFTPIIDTITSASLTFGIYDSDAGGVGLDETDGITEVSLADEQLDFFNVGSTNLSLKAELIAAGFEDAGQALNNQFEIYTVALPGSTFGDLATGTFDVDLGLHGPVFSPAVLVFLDDVVHDFNGANVIFSTVTINTTTGGGVVPEPNAALVWGIALLGGVGLRRRRR